MTDESAPEKYDPVEALSESDIDRLLAKLAKVKPLETNNEPTQT